jgi:hypothetical protein
VDPQSPESLPGFSLQGVEKRPCEEVALRTDDNGEDQVRWSLIVPRDGRLLENAHLSIIYRYGRNTSSVDSKPLEFPPNRLAEIVEECQRRTLPAGQDPAEIWTLAEIRQKLEDIK